MSSLVNGSEKKSIDKKRIILITTLVLSAVAILITLILMDFSSLGIPEIKKNTGSGLIDSSIFYSGEKLYDYLAKFDSETMQCLLTVHAIDYVFMIAVCVFEIAVLVWLSKHNFKILFLGTFAFLELFFDLSENLFVDFVVRKLPEKTSMISNLCGVMTLCKWIFVTAYVISATAVLISVLIKKIKGDKDNSISTENNTIGDNEIINKDEENED